MLERRLRLISGLVMAAYIIPHLINHTFGLLSVDAMEAVRRVVNAPWKTAPGTLLLAGAFLLHFGLGLVSLYRRAHLHIPRWEAAQLVLGLLVWPLLLAHVIGTMGSNLLLGIKTSYTFVVASIWAYGPWMIVRQTVLLLVVWIHLAISLHFWLRLKPWYRQAQPYLFAAAVLLPTLAVLGFLRAGLDLSVLALRPGWLQGVFREFYASPASLRAIQANLEPILLAVMAGLLGLVLAARAARRAYRSRHGIFRVALADGPEIVSPVGHTLLEALRNAGVPHASVCGGRGRCTTCRVSVDEAAAELDRPNEVESRALARIDAGPSVRLACQIRPRRDLRVTPLLPPNATAAHAALPGGVHGREQEVVVLFVDLRGSTRLGEAKLPYDVLFILNQFFAEMTAALNETGGHYAQFTGDGLMALYGTEGGLGPGCRNALDGARRMLARLEALNRRLAGELPEPLRMGIGIHAGEAIVGTMGPPASPNFTAIGDNVNIAARLESHSKVMGCPLVISAAVAGAAGLDTAGLSHEDVAVRGREEPVTVFGLTAEALAGLRPVAA